MGFTDPASYVRYREPEVLSGCFQRFSAGFKGVTWRALGVFDGF